MGKWLGVIACIAVAAACDSARPGPPAPEPDLPDNADVEPPPEVTYVGGCSALLDDEVPRCLVEPLDAIRRHGPVRLWIDGLDSDIEVRLDGKPLEIALRPCDAPDSCGETGILVSVNSPIAEGSLDLRVAGESAFQLVFEPMPADFVAVRGAIETALLAWNLKDARTAVENARPWLSAPARQQLDCYEVRLAFVEHDWTTVFDGPDRLAKDHHPLDRICIADLNAQAAFAAIELQPDFELARKHLRSAADTRIETASIEYEFRLGMIEHRLGRPLASVQRLQTAARLARRIGDHYSAAGADIQAGVALASLGRFSEATDLCTRALADPNLDVRTIRELRDSAHWIQLSWRNEDPGIPDPSPEIRQQIEAYARIEGDDIRADRMRINLALAAQQNGDHETVRAEIHDIDLESLDLRNLVYYEILQAGVAGAERRFAAAREHLDRADVFAVNLFEPDYSLRVSLARFELELQADRVPAALAAFARVEHFAEGVKSSITPSAGRSLFDIRLREARAEQIELLLDLDDPRAALCTVLGARARNIQTLAAGRDRLGADPAKRHRHEQLMAEFSRGRAGLEADAEAARTLSGREHEREEARMQTERIRLEGVRDQAIALIDQAPSHWDCNRVLDRNPEHALLTMHPAPDGGWWFLGARDQKIHRLRIDAEPGERELAEALARPELAALFEGAKRVVIVPISEMNGIDFHVLSPLRDIPVTYGLGLDPPQRAEARGEFAVVHAGERLAHAQPEAEQVTGLLRKAGWTVQNAWPGDTDPLPELLHFAGHGDYAGTSGWDSRLWLTGDDDLTSAEVLASQRAPAIVILGACDAGTNNTRAIDGGMNMASAFLLAGAELVIAPDEPVDDELAMDFALALHRETPGPDADLGLSLVTALARVQRDEPRFAAWRAWVP